jgi:hypothetical protein
VRRYILTLLILSVSGWSQPAQQRAEAPEIITIPMEGGGSVEVRDPQFIRVDQFNINQPVLSFGLVNKSVTAWTTLNIYFDIGVFCGDEVRLWSASVEVNPNTKSYVHTIQSAVPGFHLQGCYTELITARIGTSPANNPALTAEEVVAHRTQGEAAARMAVEEQKRLRAEQIKIIEAANAEADAEAEVEAKAEAVAEAKAAAKAKQAAAQARAKAAAQKLADEAKKAADAENARQQAAVLQRLCAALYSTTADKKISDLTVKEEEQVRACQGIGMYHPK